MNRIQSHLIASKAHTAVYSQPIEGAKSVTTVAKGSWLGEIERQGEWIHVIGIDFEGWVMKADAEELPPMQLHVVWSPGKPISYMHLPTAS